LRPGSVSSGDGDNKKEQRATKVGSGRSRK
jgi:hypothetical protein